MKNMLRIRSFLILAALVAAFGLFHPADARHNKKTRNPAVEAPFERPDEASIAIPANKEVCFSPDEPCDVKLSKFVDSAAQTLDVAIYDINLDALVHHLIEKAHQKDPQITVRVVVDRRQSKGEHSGVPTLIQAGVPVRYGRQRGIMHNKFIIVDGKELELGSFNYTHHASFQNQENQLYLTDPAVVGRYKTRFEKIWSEADPAN